MAKFFIERPIFAWVIALFIIVMGAVSITQLPIAQYPPKQRSPPAVAQKVRQRKPVQRSVNGPGRCGTRQPCVRLFARWLRAPAAITGWLRYC